LVAGAKATADTPPPATGADGPQAARRRDRETDGGTDFALGYAITVHKSQGSSAQVIIMVADDSPGARRIGCRELVYTAISRAEQLCIITGSRRAIEADCRQTALPRRQTALLPMLRAVAQHNHRRLNARLAAPDTPTTPTTKPEEVAQ
jgi:hypothetical protein